MTRMRSARSTNASYAIAVTDTAANIASEFRPTLNADAHVTSIAPRGGGTPTLTLTLTQALTDTRALSILDPFTVTVLDTAAGLQALTATQIVALGSAGVAVLEASDTDVTLTTAQQQALGAAGIALEEPFSGGSAGGDHLQSEQRSPERRIPWNRRRALHILYRRLWDQWQTDERVLQQRDDEDVDVQRRRFLPGRLGRRDRTGLYCLYDRPCAKRPIHDRFFQQWDDGDVDVQILMGAGDGAYQNATGLGYSSFENVHNAAGVLAAKAEDITNGSGDLLLSADGLTASSSSGQLSVTTGMDTFLLNSHPTEAISANGLNSETFALRLRLRPKLDYGPLGGRRRERCRSNSIYRCSTA